MLRVRISNDTERQERVLENNQTIRAAFEAAGIDTMTGTFLVNGTPINNLDQTFEQLGCGDDVRIARAGFKCNA